jgi:hypothetical protein
MYIYVYICIYIQYFFEGAKVLELFSCYESILPGFELDVCVGVGWYGDEVRTITYLHLYKHIHVLTYTYGFELDVYVDMRCINVHI